MEGLGEERPLVVITGPTGSGKSALAVRIAQKFDGEIVSADSRAVYKYMDLGTAKPNKFEQGGVTHWGLDIVEPDNHFSVANFKHYADEKIADIRRRGKTPILVGGTGLYVSSVIYNYAFSRPSDAHERALYESMTVDQLIDYCNDHNVKLPENYRNKRHLIRAIETKGHPKQMQSTLQKNMIVVGIATEPEVLKDRIAARTEYIFEHGIVDEASFLGKKYGWDIESMSGNVYRIIRRMLNEEVSLNEAKELNNRADWQLIKRQKTWFRRDGNIQWLDLDKAYEYIANHLAK